MKKILTSILAIVLCFTLVACGSSKEKEKETKTAEGLNEKQIAGRLMKIDTDLVNLWNEVFCEVSWYTGAGTSSTGGELDIDKVVSNAKKYYDKVVDNKEFIDSLSDEYLSIKTSYERIVEEATIIYNGIKKETPQVNVEVEYSSNITSYNEFQNYFASDVQEFYLKAYSN